MEEDIEELTRILNNAENEKNLKDEKISTLKQEIAGNAYGLTGGY